MPLDIDRFAHLASPMQRWDPRFKTFSLGLFILSVALVKAIPLSAMALTAALMLVWMAGLPPHFIAGGVKWVMLFLLPFFIIMPLSYPGEPAFRLVGLPFAWEGLRLAVLIVLKAVAIVLTAYAIFGSSRFDISLLALQRLKCPRIIVQMLLFTYRYIFVFLAEMRRMDIAMSARGFVKKADRRTLRVIGNFIGTLLIRSFERTERIYKAMLSKGYQGEFHTLVKFAAVRADWVKAALMLIVAGMVFGADVMGVFNPAVKGWY